MPRGIEIVVGARNDASFEPLIVVGLGGIVVDVLKDTVLSPAPVSDGSRHRSQEAVS